MSYKSEPKKLNDILDKVQDRICKYDKSNMSSVFRVWKKVVGRHVTNATEVLKFEDDVLHIRATNSAWRHELHLRKKKIIKDINTKLEKGEILDIVIKH